MKICSSNIESGSTFKEYVAVCYLKYDIYLGFDIWITAYYNLRNTVILWS